MAYEIETINERNIDTPLTNFPVGEDNFPRMSDVSSTLLPLVIQYNNYYQSNNIAAAERLLATNPELNACIHNAEKWNQIRDAIIAMERFLLNQVTDIYNQISVDTDILYNDIADYAEQALQHAIGINDSPTAEYMSVVSYSAEKVQPLFETRNVTLTLSGWSTSAPYTQTVSVAGMKADFEPTIACKVSSAPSKTDKKKIEKSWGFVDSVVVNDGSITATCKFDKPVCDIPLVIKGA